MDRCVAFGTEASKKATSQRSRMHGTMDISPYSIHLLVVPICMDSTTYVPLGTTVTNNAQLTRQTHAIERLLSPGEHEMRAAPRIQTIN